jgi:hypothetical protein
MNRTGLLLLAGALAASAALAASPDPRGWSAGTIAARTVEVVTPVPDPPELPFPKAVTEAVKGPTLLFYFSPSCPHCRHVAAEVQALHQRLQKQGLGSVLGIASGSSDPAALLEFKATYGVTFPVLTDNDRSIMTAMAVQSTPSAMLVERVDKGKLRARDVWYPYLPGWDGLVEGRLRGDIWTMFQPGEYLGNNACAVCHTQEQASWRLSHHSVAWRTLVRGQHESDSACTGCHVTGAGQPTGWDGNPDSALVDVGCEACHGPGGPHDGARLDAKTACAQCHDDKHSIAFSVEKGLPLIDHFQSNAMTPGEVEARMRALYAGEAPRDLLAFPAGDNVGSGKCLACHAVEHAWWSSSAHANGMASLRAKGRDDPACVRCHATAKLAGPAPTTLEGFDVLGGVGCESCHGPGETHVAAGGGTSNIQGLGDSCPVCVIEAVCTSCHTPTWSPDWNLDRALEAIRHVPAAP